MQMTTTEIAAAVRGASSAQANICAVCIDSRHITPGCLFVAIKGENFDGHDFVADAIVQGAAAVMVSCLTEPAIPTVTVADTGAALLALAGYYRRRFQVPLVGVTGSVGKTTTKEMTACVLGARYRTLKTEGNLNNEVGLPLTLFQMDESIQAAVVEMGMSDFGEIARLSRAAGPTIGIITKIGVSHIESLGSQQGILQAKLEITEGMAHGAPLLLNGDDALLRTVELSSHPVVYYGVHNEGCAYRAVDIIQEREETRFTLLHPGGREGVTIPAIGLHNVYNAVAAFAAGVLAHVPPADAAAALGSYRPAGMRQRVVHCEGLTVIEDCYNASPDSVKAALEALRGLPGGGRRVAVLGDMLELGAASVDAHIACGRATAGCADLLLSVGGMARYYEEGARAAGLAECRSFDDVPALAEALPALLRNGDIVLVKASRGVRLEEALPPVYTKWNKLI